jgi:peptidyl-dipeptidase Dcp
MKKITGLFLMVIILASCAGPQQDNPFFSEYNTPFGVPPFNLIENDHFLPAFKEGIKQQEAEIDAIVNNPEPATFENTIAALDYSGMLINRVGSVFYNYLSSNTSDEIQAIAQEVAPMMSAHGDNISLNMDLFARIQAVYEQKDQLGLNEEQEMLLEETYRNFVRNGAALPEEKQERFREINQELATITLQFGQNVLADVNSWQMFIENEEDLAGLPQSVRDAAAEAAAAKEKKDNGLSPCKIPV